MHVALYARVSTERQEREQTIDSQLAALRAWVEQQGHALVPEHVYTDEGYSGARLDRPGLDRLRDDAREGQFEAVAVLSPDRLARKYAYQVLLLEELRHSGCAILFLQHPLGDDPNDHLLLQIQGAIAEYERALLGERFRRGKLQKARSGQFIGGRAPYGYRYVLKQEGVPGHLVIDESEAAVARMLYRWLIDERLSIRQILKRLNFGPWYPRSGRRPWSPSVVHHILADPVYTGTAYANRYRYVPPRHPRTPRGPRTADASCRQLKPQAEWIPIPVPAIIDDETFALAQAQLARNSALSFRHNTKYSYLLRCLLTCGVCGLAMFGVTYKARGTQPERRYYDCHGKDCILSAREQPCPRRVVKAAELETAVWQHVVQLLREPDRLLEQFQASARAALEGDTQEQAERNQLAARLDRLEREERRLLDAYQAEVITLEELAQRRKSLAQRRHALRDQQEQWARLRQERLRTQAVLHDLRAFCARIASRLDTAAFEERQTILQLLIERVIVKEDTLEIRHVIPLRNGPEEPVGGGPGNSPLRSDGVKHTALPQHVRPEVHLPQRRVQPATPVVQEQLQARVGPQPARVQPLQQPPPTRFVFARAQVPIQDPARPARRIHAVGHQHGHLHPSHPLPLPAPRIVIPLPGGPHELHPDPVEHHHRGHSLQRALA
jgi:site-specific DNA recombinase